MTAFSTQAIDRYSRYCGPACVAAVLDIPRTDAAAWLRLLQKQRGQRARVGSAMKDMVKVINDSPKPVRARLDRKTDREFTLGQWLRFRRDVEAIVWASKHVIYVYHGSILADNGIQNRKAKIRGIIFIEREEA